MVSILFVNIRLMNSLIFIASIWPVLCYRSMRYRSFGNGIDYDSLPRPQHHQSMSVDEMAATLRMAETKPVVAQNPFTKFRPQKRDDKLKRCGKVLVKFVMKVCDFCITPSNTKPVPISRRKRDVGEMDQITEACCKRPCSAADISVFCCHNQRTRLHTSVCDNSTIPTTWSFSLSCPIPTSEYASVSSCASPYEQYCFE